MILKKLLDKCAELMSKHESLCLLTLMVFLGLLVGLWNARATSNTLFSVAKDPKSQEQSRGATAQPLCVHASVAFDPKLSVQQMSRVLRSEEAWIVFGPDAFGEYQVRFSNAVSPAEGVRALQGHSEIAAVKGNPQCQ